MKAITFIFLFFILASFANAQLRKGQWMVGGRADFSHSNGNASFNNLSGGTSKETTYAVSTGIAYFFMDRFCAGIRVGAGGSHSKENFSNPTPPVYFIYSSESKINSINISPFARYYLLEASKKINLFAEASYTYAHGKSESKFFQAYTPPGLPPAASQSFSSSKFNSNSYSIAAGPVFFLNPKVSLELSLEYSFTKISGGDQSANTFGAGAGFQVHLGK